MLCEKIKRRRTKANFIKYHCISSVSITVKKIQIVQDYIGVSINFKLNNLNLVLRQVAIDYSIGIKN